MGRLISARLAAVGVCAALTLMAVPALASASPGHIRGLIPANTPAGRAWAAKHHPGLAGLPLVYHGGPVMHADLNVAIYWEPAGFSTTTAYKNIVDTYFNNVGAASGTTVNDYSVATQYYDGSGPIKYISKLGAAGVDTRPYPTSGCSAGSPGEPCITDLQLETELNTLITRLGAPRGLNVDYYMFLPPNVATCI